MNKQELAELRRRFNPEKTTIDYIRGCFVNEKREIVAQFAQPLLTLPAEEVEKYLSLFKRAMSGQQGKNLVDIAFRPDQVLESDAHRLLSSMVSTALKVDQAVDTFYHRVIDSLDLEDSYLILLMHDAYDIPYHAVDENRSDVISEDVFNYMVCSICPVKLTKPALCYCSQDSLFHDREGAWTVCAPELGFLFPTFEDRMTNIYGALFYTRDDSVRYDAFANAVFDNRAPMPAEEQRVVFDSLISDVLEDDCSLDVLQTMHDSIRERVEEVKSDRTAPTPTVTKREVSKLLSDAGIPEERVSAFEERYDEEFGTATELPATNIVDTKRFELRTPDVIVKVNPERSDLIETRMIDGTRYIMIRANEGVEVNGISINIQGADTDAPF